uniref:bifunctional glutamate N-acetyltransferase/amino-acid acetyltransferase ArgJ n=1 Tax=Candidatus Planktophila sp. TaxID=2175601 RepID=UPI00404A747D
MNLPQGFIGAATAAGLKSSGAKDLTLIVNQGPSSWASAVFTTNQVLAAPVIWSKEVIKRSSVRAVVLNSGGANACTGPRGFQDTHQSAEHVASLLQISSSEIFVCSTGVIGEFLPMEKIVDGINSVAADLSSESLLDCAQAIMTTDSVPKISTVNLAGTQMSGIAKGAGMLAPALATMLSVIMTDAVVPDSAERIFQEIIEKTFNRIDSDGCTSTNDTILLMSSGASGIALDEDQLAAMLQEVCESLANQLIADAEGSTKTININVRNAKTEQDAVNVARSCARNNLLKAAIFGGDPNWGRVLAAVGTADAYLDPLTIDVSLNGVAVCVSSAPAADKTLVSFDDRLVHIEINLNVGSDSATVQTNDLSHAYVHENSAYST